MNELRSIKYKTLLYLALFSIFILLILWGSQVLLSNYLYEKYQISDMNKIVAGIRTISEEGTDEELISFLANTVYNYSVCIEYVTVDDSFMFNDKSTGCLLGKDNYELANYKADLFLSADDTKALKLINRDYKSNALLYGVRVKTGYIYLYSMLSNVNKNEAIIKGQLVYMTLIVIIIAVFISFFISKIISQPIVKITKKSRQLAEGNYNVKFEKNGIKEIDELADTLNYLEKEVSKTDQYRRDLMANVSHDLKTPLTMIKAYAEMVRDITYDDKEKREENLNVIIEETDRLNVLVNDILVLSKIQNNSNVLELEVFDLKKEIDSICKKYAILQENEGYEIIVDLPSNAMVKADKKKINQVIYNLINNAINYTGNDKKVYISVKEEKKNYIVKVRDTGEGINKDELEHIWDKYYKNEKNHKRNKIGTGLGLSIVKNILETHNFRYGVNSIKGKGTTFYFEIKKKNVKN